MKRLFLILAIGSVLASVGQNYTTFYNFESVGQNLMINPANPHPYRFVIGLPVASGISVNYTNTVFKLGDFFNDATAGENLKKIVDNLDNKERLNLYENTDIIYAGFGIKSGYISFGVQQEVTFNMQIPGQLLQYLYYGNLEDEDGTLNIGVSDFNAEALIQNNYHIGYQHWLLDSTLIVGGRFKFISGTGHGHFNTFNASIYSDIFEWRIQTDILSESSGYGYIEDFDKAASNPFELFNSGNNGWGVDLGATYLLPKMKISASVLNIGAINWKNDINIYQSQGEFVWNGVEINETDQEIDFDEVLDSLQNQLEFKELTPYSYKTKLPMHIMASYEYQVHPKHAFALTYQGSVWSGNLYNNFGVNYMGRYAKRFNLILGYSRLQGNLNSVSFGFSAAVGPVQLFLMTDNAWGVLKPAELSATSLRLGLNLVFFDREPKQPKKEDSTNN